uniref:Uncharacterized protein n=1 Tax=Arundo donax TaxID=35708 RepID=A0A0A9C6V1_ARUDO
MCSKTNQPTTTTPGPNAYVINHIRAKE